MRPFTQMVAELRRGRTGDELTEAMQALVHACKETGKTGALTLVIKVTPGKSGQVEITDAIKTNLPVFSRESSLFFVTDDGDLSRKDPRQEELPGLRGVEDETRKSA
jgi:hypothetical protein